jgi:hypothetical protein
MRQIVAALIIVYVARVLLGCAHGTGPSPVTPPPDAADASPCDVDDAINAGRLIRQPDGAALYIVCGDT